MQAQDLFVKICGITNLADAQLAAKVGANAVGFVFHKGSERYIDPERAKSICAALPRHLTKIGVFVHADRPEIAQTAKAVGLSAVQLVGDEGPDDLFGYEWSVFKVFQVRPSFDVESMRNFVVDAFLLDAYKKGAYGGTGKTFDWNLAVKAKSFGRVILAGGLTPENVGDAVRFVRPYGVDVSSGVEARPGKKDERLVREFVAQARNASLSIETL
ncbi:MAG: phosphoribosylanthranilate isomerase [Bacteroidetes bacterium]|jgi:phosphoribosylanthranilate isomerase|nr:phosphoribosylanthranilate isomerase [Bacteroidota bacterium]